MNWTQHRVAFPGEYSHPRGESRSIDFIAARNSRIDQAVNVGPGEALGRSVTG